MSSRPVVDPKVLEKAADVFMALIKSGQSRRAAYAQVCKRFEFGKKGDPKRKAFSKELQRRKDMRHGQPEPEPEIELPQRRQGTLDFDEWTSRDQIDRIVEWIEDDPSFIIEGPMDTLTKKEKLASQLSGMSEDGIVIPTNVILKLMRYIDPKDMPQVSVMDGVIQLQWDSGQELELYFDDE